MKKSISADLIRKYIAGTCSPEEMDKVHEWYDAFESVDDAVIDMDLKQQLKLKVRMLEQIKTNIQPLALKPVKNRSWIFRYSPVISAAAVVLVVLAFVLYQTKFMNGSARNAVIAGLDQETVLNNTTQTIQKYILSDGSSIWLSPMAKVQYKKNFDPEKRILNMTGEVFFEVSKDKNRPFVIYAGGVVTKVWGTSFSVTTGKRAEDTEIAVLTGKVSVKVQESAEDKELMLLPNQKAVYTKHNHELRKDKTPAHSKINIWKKEGILFDNMLVEQVIEVLNAKFDVNITTANKALAAHVLKADFTGQSLPDILLIMGKTLNVTYQIEDKNIILYQIN